jgi:hypothetical protein
VPAVAILRQVWMHHDRCDGIQLHGREAGKIPPAPPCISSPDDAGAHDARQPTTPWVGDKVHLTETGEDDGLHLSTSVDTPIGPAADGAATPHIHAALPQRGLLPGTHLVDTGCLEVARLVESQDDFGVDLPGLTRLDDHWQARAGSGFDAQHFQIDWPQPHYQALQAARQREATDAFRAAYARRTGLAGTISHGTRSTRLRRTRDTGLTRVHLGHILTAVGLNVRRLGEWWRGTARVNTRITPFARRMADAAAA